MYCYCIVDLLSGIYEVSTKKQQITFDLPVLVAFFVYSYAKLRMLEFYYDFLDRVLDRADFQLIEMDTGGNIVLVVCELCLLFEVITYMVECTLQTGFVFSQPV
jgi:hypothetical protein